MRVLLSIKPEFAEKIFAGEKKYEFRRTIFKRGDVQHVVVYASAPVCRVIGEFEIETIISADLDTLWSKTKNFSGVTKDYFFRYFTNRESGHAIKINRPVKYSSPLCVKCDLGMKPPQSYAYLS